MVHLRILKTKDKIFIKAMMQQKKDVQRDLYIGLKQFGSKFTINLIIRHIK